MLPPVIDNISASGLGSVNEIIDRSLASSPVAAGSRIVVAMSGGVDSSVTAAVLHDRGYEVVGITLRLYDSGAAPKRAGACCAGADIKDAVAVAAKLGIAHYVLDYAEKFKKSVIEPFADAYAAGETPVPCIACNRTVKFHDLLATARELNAAALATGHYVQKLAGKESPQLSELHMAADASRDQSYFLFSTTREQLDYLLFPLGGIASKSEVRQLAQHYGLMVQDKPDSQDICFVPQGRYDEIVAKLRPEIIRDGEIVDLEGQVLGSHQGISGYTVGQRRGLGIAYKEPLFVLALDAATNRVTVGPQSALACSQFSLKDCNWLLPEAKIAQQEDITVKIRSTQPALAAEIVFSPLAPPRVTMPKPAFGVAPGQAAVFYQGSQVIGGGFIAKPENSTQNKN